MTLPVQWLTVGVMVSSGLMIGIILDLYHVVKDRLRLQGWIVSVVDLLYWFVSAGLVFSLLMWSNWGELRFSLFIAILLGVFLYYRYVSQLVIPLLRLVLNGTETVIGWVARCLWIPIAGLGTVLRTSIRVLFWPITWLGQWIGHMRWWQAWKQWWLKITKKG